MKVVITAAAEADLEDIGDFIARDSPRRAISFVDELVAAARGLAEYPDAYPLVPDYESRGIRRRPYGNYLIFYAVRPGQVTVERILNGARDYEEILFPED